MVGIAEAVLDSAAEPAQDVVGVAEDVLDTAAAPGQDVVGAAEVVLDTGEEAVTFWQMPGKTTSPIDQSSQSPTDQPGQVA